MGPLSRGVNKQKWGCERPIRGSPISLVRIGFCPWARRKRQKPRWVGAVFLQIFGTVVFDPKCGTVWLAGGDWWNVAPRRRAVADSLDAPGSTKQTITHPHKPRASHEGREPAQALAPAPLT
jgi:hypothetical protein